MTFLGEVKGAMKSRVMGLLVKPQEQQKVRKPKNMAWLALLGFNLVMTFLDLISAVAVAMLTTPLYGVLTFIAGVAALFMWERLFVNPYANLTQKWMAALGGVLAILSTLGIGVLSAIANVLDVAGAVTPTALEVTMLISLVVVAFIHGTTWGVYYFTDPNHIAEMKRVVSIAWRESQKRGLDDAKEDLRAVLDMDKELQEYEANGQLDLLSAAYENLRGQSLVPDENKESPEYKEWLKKGATSPVPLAGADDEI